MSQKEGKAETENGVCTVLKSESRKCDVLALFCDIFILAVLVWTQVFYRENMLFLILPLIGIGAFLILSIMLPEQYTFREEYLEIGRPLQKTTEIRYDSVFNYEAKQRDSVLNITSENVVKVYYQDGRRRKVCICRPQNTDAFVETLKINCPVFIDNL